MNEERTIRAALKVDANQIRLPDDLLERINSKADTLAPVRQSRWSLLPLGPKLEVLAACILLVAMVGLGAVRNLGLSRAPGGSKQGSGPQGTVSEKSKPQGLPTVSQVTKAYFTGWARAVPKPLDRSVVTMVLGWLKDAQVVGMDKEIFRPRGSDFVLVMELQSGDRITVRLAADCVNTRTTAGSTRTDCNSAQGQVNLIAGAGEAPRILAPELAGWMSSQMGYAAPAQSTTGVVTEGAGDLMMGGMRATFSAPSSPAKITEEQARESTIKQIGQPPADAKVSVEYVLVTLPGPIVLNGKKMDAYPVYLVTYDGVRVISTGGPDRITQGASGNMDPPSTGAQEVKGKITAFIDASDGEWIMAVER